MLRTLLIVALGGGVGSALRYAVSKFVQDNMSGAFPYHTFAVNIAPACAAASPRSPRSATRTSRSCVATTLSSPYSTSPVACSADYLP